MSREGATAFAAPSRAPGAPAAVKAEAEGEAYIRLNRVSVRYEQASQPVLQDIQLTIQPGESVLFLGPSGCGKSTLGLLLAHLLPGSVEAIVAGEVERHPDVRDTRSIGYVFQDPDAQFCMLTAADEIAFGLENQQVPRADIARRIPEVLEDVGLPVAGDASPATFSGGMKQKLAMACALAASPKLLILDEPTANLDPQSTQAVFAEIARLHRRRQTMVVIEHKFAPLLPHMDKVVLFDKDGRIVRSGSPTEIVEGAWPWLISEGVVPAWQSPTDLGHRTALSPPLTPPASRGDVLLTVTDGSLRYGDTQVWRDVHMSVAAGEFVAIVGPNGSGKSSLLQVMAGLTKPTGGTVALAGKPLGAYRRGQIAERVAYCFQNPEFQFIYERVADELANSVVGDLVPPEITTLLAEFGLSGTAQQSPFALSQGQKRRLSVAAMVRQDHALYLLDEPTFGQDARTQEAIMARLSALHQGGKAVVMTTHDMALVRQYATRVIVVAAGGIQFDGTYTDLLQRPDILEAAHLLDDKLLADVTRVDVPDASEADPVEVARSQQDVSDHTRRPQRQTPLQTLHAAWLFIWLTIPAVTAVFANTLPEACAMLVLAVLTMAVMGRMGPLRIGKLLAPFLVMYVIYILSLGVNAAPPPGTAAVHLLWWTVSWYGFLQGLILAVRMLASAGFAMLFLTQIDLTDFIVGLTKDLRVPPKFAYATMAGLRVVPLFQSEWTKLRQARQLRGRDNNSLLGRAATYAMPLLSQAIRLSERVAIAMEARGFVEPATSTATARSFYRTIQLRPRDFVFGVVLTVLALLCVTAV